MAWYFILLYAVIQGVTEFLPISSSGHLVLAHEWVNGQAEHSDEISDRWAQDAVIDIAVHVGTLFSVLLYFWRDFWRLLKAFFVPAVKKQDAAQAVQSQAERKLGYLIVLASLPVIIAGFFLHQWQPDWLRSPQVVAWATLIFAYVLWICDRFRPATLELKAIGVKEALIIGLAQILALIPGTSRSGITMSAARALGFTRDASARFSLFLAVIAISGAGTLSALKLLSEGNYQLGYDALIAAVISFAAGYASIALMLKWLQRFDFTPFVIYRSVLALVLILVLYLN